MAHVVGVPRRDPCQKCRLPVFLAERLTVGKKVFHRTCLKCARCGSQLTPGSFYETEVDNEFCCETCPDEEFGAERDAEVDVTVVGSELGAVGGGGGGGGGGATAPSKVGVRSSIAERLAFFEKSNQAASVAAGPTLADHRLLQKSVSDEEKSASLKRAEGGAAVAESPYRSSAALSSFLGHTLAPPAVSDSAATTPSELKSDSQMEMTTDGSDDDDDGTDDESGVEQPPALPSTLPPTLGDVDRPVTPTSAKRYTTTAQLRLDNNDIATAHSAHLHDDDEESDENGIELRVKPAVEAAVPAEKRRTAIQLLIAVDPSTTVTTTKTIVTTTTPAMSDMANNNREQQLRQRIATEVDKVKDEKEHEPATMVAQLTNIEQLAMPLRSACLVLRETNVNDYATKDEIADIVMETDVTDSDMVIVTNTNSTANTTTTIEAPALEHATVEAPNDVNDAMSHNTGDKVTERLSVVRARLQQFEVGAINNHCDNNNQHMPPSAKAPIATATTATKSPAVADENADDFTCITCSDKSVTLLANDIVVDDDNVLGIQTNSNVTAFTTTTTTNNIETPTTTNVEDEIKLQPMDVDVKHTQSLNEVPLDGKRSADVEAVLQQTEIEEQAQTQTATTSITANTNIKPLNDVEQNDTSIGEYPDDLNPFKSDDDDENDAKGDAVMLRHNNNNNSSKKNNKENLSPRPKTLHTMTHQQRLASAATQRASTPAKPKSPAANMNPFDSSDDEIELEKRSRASSTATTPSSSNVKVPPPRPPPPRISRNPFDNDDDDDAHDADEEVTQQQQFVRRSSLTSSSPLDKRTPVPTPRTNVSQSQSGTPEPTPRLSTRASPQALTDGDCYGSANSLGHGYALTHTPASAYALQRNSEYRGSNNSLASSSGGGTVRSRKSRKAPAPPQATGSTIRELFPALTATDGDSGGAADAGGVAVVAAEGTSKASTPSSSTMGTPRLGRKKRPAPAPPKPARLDPSGQLTTPTMSPPPDAHAHAPTAVPKNLHSYPLQSDLDSSKLSDEEKALLEGKQQLQQHELASASQPARQRSSLRLIPLDADLLRDLNIELPSHTPAVDGSSKCDDLKQQEETNVVYRRAIAAPQLLFNSPMHERSALMDGIATTHDRQLEKLKDNKEAQNRNRQSQISATSSGGEDSEHGAIYGGNKSSHGKWKRRKGPAPALPIPPRKVLQMLPLQEIRHELDIIEVQQQGLEKQGVILEKMIRDRCEGHDGEPPNAAHSNAAASTAPAPNGGEGDAIDSKSMAATAAAVARESVQNSKEVEDLILQLFELVNEKNELFRRQAELMYLRRQHRLEQEQADLEYEIRVLMAQPECNKTDTDKAREEALIARMVEVVQLRNEVIECLEMDRLREAEEDLSIKQRLELHTSKRDEDECDSKRSTAKLSKKEKKKQKEAKKLCKSKKIDADKDADESELGLDKDKLKKKKKKFLF